MQNENPLLVELIAHAARMRIIKDNSSDQVTQSLAGQATEIAHQLIIQMNQIFVSHEKGESK
jgi:hypothetical protein